MILIQKVANHQVSRKNKVLILIIWCVTFQPFLLFIIEIFNHVIKNQKDPEFDVLVLLWKIYFYINLVIGYVFLPISISFYKSGRFSFFHKFFEALKERCIIYSIFIGLSVLIYLGLCLFEKNVP